MFYQGLVVDFDYFLVLEIIMKNNSSSVLIRLIHSPGMQHVVALEKITHVDYSEIQKYANNDVAACSTLAV